MSINNTQGKGAASIDQLDPELREIMPLMGRVFRALKRNQVVELPRAIAKLFGPDLLGKRHLPILVALTLEGAMSVGEIAERLGLSIATTSLMVGELDDHGLINRTQDKTDRRRTLVTVSSRYKPVVKTWLQKRSEPIKRTLERMNKAERKAFIKGWRLLAEEVTTQHQE